MLVRSEKLRRICETNSLRSVAAGRHFGIRISYHSIDKKLLTNDKKSDNPIPIKPIGF